MAKKPEPPTVDELKLPDATTKTLPDGSPAAGQATEAKIEDSQHPAEALGIEEQPQAPESPEAAEARAKNPDKHVPEPRKVVVIPNEEAASRVIAETVVKPFDNSRRNMDLVMAEHLAPLVGGRIMGLISTNDDDPNDKVYGLNVVVDHGVGFPTHKYDVWIQADPEGNGPGFLAIEETT